MVEVDRFWEKRLQEVSERKAWAANMLRHDRRVAKACQKAEQHVASAAREDIVDIARSVFATLIKEWSSPRRGLAARKSVRRSMSVAIAICISDKANPNQAQTYRLFPSLPALARQCERGYASKAPIQCGDAVIQIYYGGEEWMAVFPSGEISTFMETVVRSGGAPEFPFNAIACEAVAKGFRRVRKLVSICAEAALNEKDLIVASEFQSSRAAEEIEQRKAAWARVHFPGDTKVRLMEQCEKIVSFDTLTPESMLLSGPPGTGKSFFCSQISHMVGWSVHKITPADLKQRFLGHSGQATRELWAKLRRQPSVLVLEECDSIFAKRESSGSDRLSEEILQTFLAEWNGVSDNIWVIGTTNRPEQMDDAIRSRFAQTLEVTLPDKSSRLGILRDNLPVQLDENLLDSISADTQGLSGRAIERLAERIGSLPLPITQESAIKQVREIRAQFNSSVDRKANWDRLILSEETLNALKTTCAVLKESEIWAAKGVSIPRGILLEGKPGTGKTQIGRTLANESGLSFVAATLADIKGAHIGESSQRVKALFERARSAAPSILFLDELDLLTPARNGRSKDSFTSEITSQLLQEMDGIIKRTHDVFVLAATNDAASIDPAVLSRFQHKEIIPLPSREGRSRILQVALEGKQISFDAHTEAARLADRLGGYAGRDIFNLVHRAEIRALQRAVASGGPDAFAIQKEDIEAEIKPLH